MCRFSSEFETSLGLVQREGGPCGVLAPIQVCLCSLHNRVLVFMKIISLRSIYLSALTFVVHEILFDRFVLILENIISSAVLA
jgi:hypothetical protein